MFSRKVQNNPASPWVDPADPPCYTSLMANVTRKKNVRITFTPEELAQATECKRIRKLASLNDYVRLLILQDAASLRVPLEVKS